jgi:hypothetical protein
MKYRVVETALAKAFYVSPGDLPAFRAQVRRFRNLNVPSILKIGQGKQVEYSRLNVVQLGLAILLQRLDVVQARLQRLPWSTRNMP